MQNLQTGWLRAR